jgi:hypothetical protein
MRRILPPVCTLALTLLLAPAADAGWFAAEPVDGPADVDRVAVALTSARGGGLAYVKRDAGGARVWLSLLRDGAWTAPAPISGPGATETAVTGGERGRLAVAWIENGNVVGAAVGAAPMALTAGGGASDVAIDVGVNDVAYAVWTQNGDVRAAQLVGTAWQAVPAPLDIDPARSAGVGRSRPRVAVAADGSAVVVWGEALPDGRTHVFARRLYGTTLSAIPQDATLDVFEGAAAGSADSPEVAVEFDRSYAWVVFRQDVGGRSRSIARRLRASVFQEPYALDGGVTSSDPRIGMTGGGIGHAVSTGADGGVYGAALRDDVFLPAVRSDAAGAVSATAVVTSERNDSALAWRVGPEAAAVVLGRLAPEEGRLGAEAVLSRADLGPVAPVPLAASSDRIGNVAVAMLQGAPSARHVAVAMHDLPPSRPVVRALRSVVGPRPLIRWRAGEELLGPQSFHVLIDGRRVATTTRTRYRPRRLRRGRHSVQVVAIDRRGQASQISRRDSFGVRRR